MTDLAPRSYDEPLFPSIATQGTARKADPQTSKDAAASMAPTVNARQAEVLNALVQLGGEGTLDDVIAITGRYPHVTSRRLTDLEKATPPLVRKTGRTRAGRSGRQQSVWEVVR